MISEADFLGHPTKSLQHMLRQIQYFENADGKLIPDGIYGEETRQAVIRFQQAHELDPTGEADQKTWDAIVGQYNRSIEEMSVLYWPVFGDWRLAVEPGLFHPLMFLVQGYLAALKARFSEVPPVDLTGYNDGKTAAAVRWVQKRVRLPEDGVVDKFFWERLTGLYYMYLTLNEDYLPIPYSQASFSNDGMAPTIVS